MVKQESKLRQRRECQAVSCECRSWTLCQDDARLKELGRQWANCCLPAETKENSHYKGHFSCAVLIRSALKLPFAFGGQKGLPSLAGLAKMNVTESGGTCKPHFVVHGGVGESWSSQGDVFCVSPPSQGMVGGLIHKDHVAICITLTQIALCYSFRWDLLSIAYISTVKTWNISWLTYLREIYQGPVYSLWSLSKSNSTSLCFQRGELGHQWRVLRHSWG